MESATNTPDRNAGGEGLAENLSAAASQVKARASTMGRMAADKVDATRSAAADKLDTAATTLHDKADELPGGAKLAATKVAAAAHTTADTLESGAKYIRSHDVKGMMDDLQRLVKNNPGPALLGAALLGFLVARSFSRD